ncbi:MAG: zinc-regulated TonB-dependent outer membrane receptor [Proteobacteria bacterium]|nr:zinc-regulated TonB-dependent outer membrane receptor [Pseudomonadota bacterium]
MSIHILRNTCILSPLIFGMLSSQAMAQDLFPETQNLDTGSDAVTETATSNDTPSDDAPNPLEASDHSVPNEVSDSNEEAAPGQAVEQPPEPAAPPAKTAVSQTTSSSTPSSLTPEEEAELMNALAEDQQAAPSAPKNDNPLVSFIQSMNPDMAFIADFALAWFSVNKPLQTGAHDPKMIGFNLQQLEMSVAASVDHVFSFSANLVFGQAGVELEEAVVSTQGLPAGLQVRAGQFLSRVGRINNTHPHTWDFVDQPFAIGKFYGAEGNRGLGVELSWLTPLPWYVEIAGAAQMPTSNASNRTFLGNDGEVEGAQDFLYTITAKQFFSLSDEVGLFWGLSYQTAPNNTGRDTRSHIYATDIYLKYTPAKYPEMYLAFQAEAFFRQRLVPRDNLFDAVGYAQIVWQINRHWATGLRGEYGSGLDNDMLDPEWTDHRGRASVQVTWYPSHFSRLRAQASIDVPKWQTDPIYALFLALEITAGTHPAHSY